VQPKRVLVVDDEEHIREIAAASLELTCGWETLLARSGREGIALAIQERPDAVLLDVMMPDMDGPTAFAILREDERTKGIPVILLTAKIQTSDRQRYLGLGVIGVIAKPFDPLQLAAQVGDLLGWS
jgi:CheY-like chemotaxis protein